MTFLQARQQALTFPCKSPSLLGLLCHRPGRSGLYVSAHGVGLGHAATVLLAVAEAGLSGPPDRFPE